MALMHAALLLVDVQYEFLERPGVTPSPEDFLMQTGELLRRCRAGGMRVLHAHTVVREDGSDRMPHWKRDDYWACVVGSRSAATPDALAPLADEPVYTKQFFSAFGSDQLAPDLQDLGVTTLIVAGLYSHACVQATVLDAYQRGFEVLVPSDAVASIDPMQTRMSRKFLEGRAAKFHTTAELLETLGL